MMESKISIYPMLAVNFIGTLGLSLVLPFLIFLVERFGGNAVIYGLIASMYPVFQLIGGPLLGRWSDTYGRKKILLLSQTGTVISWIIFLIALLIPVTKIIDVRSNLLGTFVLTVPLLLIFIARAFDGITGGNVSVANAYLADITEDGDRSSVYGKLSVSTNLGFIFGPALAGILSMTVYREILPVLAAVLISLTGTLLILFFVPESRKYAVPINPFPHSSIETGVKLKKSTLTSTTKKTNFLEVMKIKDIHYLFIIYFLIFLGFNMFYTAFPVHATKNLKWDVASLGIYFSVLSLMLVIVEGPVLSWANKKYSDSSLAIFGSFVLATNFVLLAYGTDLLTYIALVFFALGNGLMWPSVMSILSKAAGKEHQGAVQGVSGGFTSLASIIGLVTGGFMFSFFDADTFLIAASMIYCAFLLCFKLRSLKKNQRED